MTEAMIKALEVKGFKRWTRGEHDRLYANPGNFGLEVEWYKSGHVRYAEINGEATSNGHASKILANMKVYIDLNTDKLVVSPYYNEDIMDNINAAIKAAKEETAPKEEKPMRKICENNVFGIEALPDFTGWENDEITAMCNELYYTRVYDALENIGLMWSERESTVYTDGDYAGTDPVSDFKKISEPVFDSIITMDETEIRAAYETEVE